MAWWAAIPAVAGLIGKIAGGAAKGSAEQRTVENNQASNRNALLAQLYGMNQNATMNALTAGSNERLAQGNQELERKAMALSAPTTRARQSVRGSILANAQPASLSGLPDRIASRVPTISGGLTPAMFTADTRALGNELTRSAIMDQLKGDTLTPMTQTDFKSGVLPLPQLEEYQKSGVLEKILAGIALGGSALGSLEGLGRKRTDELDNPFENAG